MSPCVASERKRPWCAQVRRLFNVLLAGGTQGSSFSARRPRFRPRCALIRQRKGSGEARCRRVHGARAEKPGAKMRKQSRLTGA